MTIHSKQSESLTTIYTTARVVGHLCQAGIEADVLLQDSGLEMEDLALPSRMLTLWQEQQVLTNALRLTPYYRLGLSVGLKVSVSAIGLLGYAMMTAPTLRGGLDVPKLLPALLGTYFDLDTDSEGEKASITASRCRAPKNLEPFLTEVCLGAFKSIMEDMLYRNVDLRGAYFSYPGSTEMKEQYEKALGCPVFFDQAQSKIVFPISVLNSELPLADKLCHQRTLELCHIQNRELIANREWLKQLRELLSDNLVAPPGLEELAGKMLCSSRTLRRQLESQNTSYRSLLDELRFEKAKELLQSTAMNVDRVAECIGFSDGAGLRRAFHRWRGVSPHAFRKQSSSHNIF